MPKTGLLTTGAIAALALGLTACGGAQAATHSHRTHSVPAASVTASAVPAATTAPAAEPTLTVTQTAQDVLATWYADGGQVTIAGLQTDLGQISLDATAQNVAAVEADGAQLASDADTAMMNGPAGGPAVLDWNMAMSDYSVSGQSAAAGDFAAATASMQAGTTEIQAITALVSG